MTKKNLIINLSQKKRDKFDFVFYFVTIIITNKGSNTRDKIVSQIISFEKNQLKYSLYSPEEGLT